jgi:hypothetical protein
MRVVFGGGTRQKNVPGGKTKALGVSALLIALFVGLNPVWADVIYKGTLAADQPYVINIDNGPIVGEKTTVTVYYLSGGKPATAKRPARLGRGAKFDVLVVAAGARVAWDQETPKDTRLIVVEVAPPANATVNVEVVQGLSSFTQTCVNGCTLTFDVQ